MNDAVYARVSTKTQDELQQIPAIVKEFGLVEPVVYHEEVTAWRIDKEQKRLEFLRLKQSIKEKKIDRLFIWDIDRLFRNREKTRAFFEYCRFYGVEIFSLNQKWLNDFQELKKQFPKNFKFLIDNMFSLMLDVYSQTAEDESTKKSERVRLKVVRGDDGVTRSTDGNKWGRRSLPARVKEEVLKHHQEGRSIRFIADSVHYYDKNKNLKSVSRGAVHKIISENTVVLTTLSEDSLKGQKKDEGGSNDYN